MSIAKPTAAPRKRGRPRQFDYDEALDAAVRTFWHRGFTATSLDHLTAAMRLNRPSVYAAFGNKDAAYGAALERYFATAGREFVAALATPGHVRESLATFFAAVIASVTGRWGPTGCMISCTLPAEAGHSAAARKRLAGAIAKIDAAILARLRAAHAAGELARDVDPTSAAQLVTNLLFSLAIRARAGSGRAELTKSARAFVDLIAPVGRPPKGRAPRR
jgi:AcrR family transcriptional regulator